MPEWTPMISSAFFDGVRADLLVAVSGILSLVLIILGLAILTKAFGN
ncbi:hypothetical protein [Desulfogranum marinum]|nr:hypothetical protein [Desulfogranum marinum]